MLPLVLVLLFSACGSTSGEGESANVPEPPAAGTPAPVADSTPTWGNILNAAKSVSVVTNQWWIWLFPGLAISLFVRAINFLGDGLRDVLDAKQQ